MTAMMHFLTLVLATVVAAGAAVLLDWLLLRAICCLMEPARRRPLQARAGKNDLVRGTVGLVRAYGVQR
jgi:hypothetical protein